MTAVQYVEIPKTNSGRRGARPTMVEKWPWRDLGIRDNSSFLMPKVNVQMAAVRANQAAARIGGGCKFTCRTVKGGVRVWRIL